MTHTNTHVLLVQGRVESAEGRCFHHSPAKPSHALILIFLQTILCVYCMHR